MINVDLQKSQFFSKNGNVRDIHVEIYLISRPAVVIQCSNLYQNLANRPCYMTKVVLKQFAFIRNEQ